MIRKIQEDDVVVEDDYSGEKEEDERLPEIEYGEAEESPIKSQNQKNHDQYKTKPSKQVSKEIHEKQIVDKKSEAKMKDKTETKITKHVEEKHQRKDVHMHYHHHYDGASKSEKKERHKKLFFDNGSFPLIALVIFIVIYIIVFNVTRPTAIPDIKDQTVFVDFNKYCQLFVVPFALFFIILTYIVYGIKSAFKTKSDLANPIVLFVGNLFNLYWGIDILFFEQRFTDTGIAIIEFVGSPLFWSALIIGILAVIWIIVAVLRGDKDE